MSIQPIGAGGIDALYMAMMEVQQESRRIAQQLRHAAEDAQVDALLDKADHIEDAAMFAAISKAVAGAAEIGGGLSTATGDAGTATFLQGGSKVASAAFDYFAGVENAAATRCETRAAAQSHLAEDAKDAAEDARGRAQALQRRIDTVQDLEHQSSSALLRA